MKLHSIYELNTDNTELDSHAGITDISTLEADFRNSYRIDNARFLPEGKYLWYPRIKQLSTGKYLLFFQDGRWGPNVYCSHSDNGTDWKDPEIIFPAHLTGEGNYMRHYATCDATELANGDIVIAAIFHAVKKDENSPSPSRFLMEEKGIVTKYSTDGGKTWSEQQTVYHGRCWEPSFLQLPDGTVHMYFTHSAPKDAIYREKMGKHVSSGVAVLTSADNGRTWTPLALTHPYIAKRIVQQKIYVNEHGVQILTDQMPVAIVLHDNKTVFMPVESQLPDQRGLGVSLVRSHDFFERTLEENEDGPEDRDNFIHRGTSPYVIQFPSGEIVVSLSDSARMQLFICNEKGTEFYGNRPFSPQLHQEKGMWGDLFMTSSHTLISSSGDTIVEKGVHSNLRTTGLGVTRMVLNHLIEAKYAEINVDGSSEDWENNTDALFVGSVSQAQTAIRAAHDGDNVYFLFEQLDEDIRKGEKIEFYVSDKKNTYLVTAGINGVSSVANNGNAVGGIRSAVKLYGTVDNGSDTDEGYAIEFALPKKLFEGDDLRVFMKMYNTDGNTAYPCDIFDGVSEDDVNTWHIVRLSDKKA